MFLHSRRIAYLPACQTAVLEGVRQAFFEWPSPDEYYRDISQPPNVIANAAYGVAVMVADGIMVSHDLRSMR